MRAIILEDNEDRRKAMKDILGDLLPTLSVEFFVTSHDMIQRVNQAGLFDVAFISLDNDLSQIKGADGKLIDAGDGIHVAQCLTTISPATPVIVHTTNMAAGDHITKILAQSDWRVSRVVPYSDLLWICEVWRSTVRDLLVSFSPAMSLSEIGVRIVNQGLRTQNFNTCFNELLRATAYCLGERVAKNGVRVEFAIAGRKSGNCVFSSTSEKLIDDERFRRAIADFAVENASVSTVIFKSDAPNLPPHLQEKLSAHGIAQIYALQWKGLADSQVYVLFLSKQPSPDFTSRMFADIAEEALMLLKLAVSSQQRCSAVQPIVYSEASETQVWPSPIRERKE